jgi:hypothetical protein
VTAIACGQVAPEEKIVSNFFRASKIRDDATLATFATASFNLRTEGAVQSMKLVSVSPERRNPLHIKRFDEAFDQAKASQETFNREKLDFQKENIKAIERVEDAENANKPIPRSDAAVQASWSKWRDDMAKHAKEVNDARIRLSRAKALAELSLSQPSGATPDVTHMDGELVEKDVTVNASVKSPEGQTADKTLIVTLTRVVLKDEAGKEQTGRWIVTQVRDAQAAPKTS